MGALPPLITWILEEAKAWQSSKFIYTPLKDRRHSMLCIAGDVPQDPAYLLDAVPEAEEDDEAASVASKTADLTTQGHLGESLEYPPI